MAEQYSPPWEADAETNSIADAVARPVPDNGVIERRRTSTSIGDIVVLTLNTHKGLSPLNRRFVLPELRDAIRAVGADIVFLQEVLGAHQRHALRFPGWPTDPQYEFLADSIWPQFAYGRNAVYPDGDHGNAVLSKFPIESHNNVDASMGPHERRGILHCTLRRPGDATPVHAFCIHLGLREHHRGKQLDLLCRLIDALPPGDPVIVAGDFNDWRLRANEVLGRCVGLQEVWSHEFGLPAKTFPARYPLLRLDRIYVRGLRVRSRYALSTGPWPHLSDHIPLAATLLAPAPTAEN